MACLTVSCATPGGGVPSSAAIEIQTEDVTRFYEIYDRANGRPTAAQLQRFYVEPGSEGLHHLMRVRNVNAERIARALAEQPELYRNARACLDALPRIRGRLRLSFDNLLRRYPEASRPPISILISRGKPVAIAGPGTGVQVALEALCSDTAARYLGADIEDRFVYLIAHEYIHVQQAPEQPNPTVLERALLEGVADFLGELISGGISNMAVHQSARGRDREELRRRCRPEGPLGLVRQHDERGSGPARLLGRLSHCEGIFFQCRGPAGRHPRDDPDDRCARLPRRKRLAARVRDGLRN